MPDSRFAPRSDFAYLSGYSYCGASADGINLDVASNQCLQTATAIVEPVPTVVTFFPHPQEFFSGQSKLLLTPLHEKALQLMALGVQQLILLPFNQQLAQLSPQVFVQTLLLQQLQAKHISVGQDFRFGQQRCGTVADLTRWANAQGIDVSVVALKCLNGERISSSRIRQALETGDLQTAATLLGRPYSLSGQVVKGQQLGRTLGFPTANLQLPAEKFLPRFGVYSVMVHGLEHHAGQPVPGVMNIGTRPTVQGQTPSAEVHLIRWSGDLYGQSLTVTLHGFLRNEQQFNSLDALRAQIQIDCQHAIETLTVGNLG